MLEKFFVVQTGRKRFRVFQRDGAWWGLVKTYSSADRARLCVRRLRDGRDLPLYSGHSHTALERARHTVAILDRSYPTAARSSERLESLAPSDGR
jgi:hypothetical protein